jgi:hypothetical protein
LAEQVNAEARDKGRCGKSISADDLRMLIACVDLWGMYRSDEDIRECAVWRFSPAEKVQVLDLIGTANAAKPPVWANLRW